MPPSGSASLDLGQVMLNTLTLRRLRKSRLLSQQELVYEFQRRNIQVSIATIKRAETGHAVRFRIVRELARYFGVSFDDLLH
jgi:transcriptional regulator with XRE-family HTH domain